MPSNYKRKSNRLSWSEEAMEQAIIAVKSGNFGYAKAATEFGVPKSTLERRCKGRNKIAVGSLKILGCGAQPNEDLPTNEDLADQAEEMNPPSPIVQLSTGSREDFWDEDEAPPKKMSRKEARKLAIDRLNSAVKSLQVGLDADAEILVQLAHRIISTELLAASRLESKS